MGSFQKIIFVTLGFLFILPNFVWADLESDQTASVTVPAQASDYQLDFARLTTGTLFKQDDIIQYQITYGAHLSFTTPITVEAQWYPGTVDSDSSSVDILDYVSGSATNGYAGATPVIDSVNKKISWTINSFPGNTTNEIVTFKLKLNSNYTGGSNVTFKAAGRLYAPGVTTPDQSDTTNFKNPQASSGGASTTPTPTPTLTPVQIKNSIQNIEVRTITDSTAGIFITSNLKSKAILRYGKSASNLSSVISTSTFSPSSLFNLGKLDAETKYYFKFSLIDQKGNQINSDIYTFITAQLSETPDVSLESLVTISNNSVISPIQEKDKVTQEVKKNILIIPKDTVFQFKFSIKTKNKIKKIIAFVRNKNVLAASSLVPEAEASTDNIELAEIEPGVYTGKFKTKPLPGIYEIYAQITDVKGNIIEKKIAEIKVIGKFTVLSAKDKSPIEGIRVYLYAYNQNSGQFKAISSFLISSGNPVFTDKNGELNINLPLGYYKADVSRLGFHDKTVTFRLGEGDKDVYPVVELVGQRPNLINTIRYFQRTTTDVFLYNTMLYADILTGSSRFFDLISALTLGLLVILTLFAFSKKHHIPLSTMASYFYYLIDHKKRNEKYIHGIVCDEKNKPIPEAHVYIADFEDEEIIEKAKTNGKGEFFSRKGGKKYLIMVMAKGYKTTPLIPYEERNHLKFKIALNKEEGSIAPRYLIHVFEGLVGMSFEALILLSFIFELLFLNSFGFVKTFPFLIVSCFNLILWTLYLYHHHDE